jgi:hypothetical protein
VVSYLEVTDRKPARRSTWRAPFTVPNSDHSESDAGLQLLSRRARMTVAQVLGRNAKTAGCISNISEQPHHINVEGVILA